MVCVCCSASILREEDKWQNTAEERAVTPISDNLIERNPRLEPQHWDKAILADKLNALQKLNQCPDFTRSQIQNHKMCP